MSGRFAFNTGFNAYMPLEERAALPAAYDLMPAVLKRAQYSSHMLGKVSGG